MTKCTLRRCLGKRGCICPARPPIGSYGSRTAQAQAPQSAAEERPSSGVPRLVDSSRATKPGSTSTNKTNKSVKSLASKLPPVKGASLPNSASVGTVKKGTTEKSNAASSEPTLLPANGRKNDAAVVGADDQTSEEATAGGTTDIANSTESGPAADAETVGVDGNGFVTICYSHYKKKIEIKNGSTTAQAIDAEYHLSFAFPNSKTHLSEYGPSDFSYENAGLAERPMVPEDPVGTYRALVPDAIYWAHVEESEEERVACEKRQDEFAQEQALRRKEREEAEKAGIGIQQTKAESCSCIEGNPCMDKYGCKDWENRYMVAKKNGWKGF